MKRELAAIGRAEQAGAPADPGRQSAATQRSASGTRAQQQRLSRAALQRSLDFLRAQQQRGQPQGQAPEGLRESMRLFLQLEGAASGENGFDPEEVLQVS